jgi:type III secretory pathway lipoprotein EscJ
MEGWKRVFSTDKAYDANLILDMLYKNNIHAVSVNDKDSSFVVLGDIDIFVHEKDEAKALKLIKNLRSE